jgi:hypothetical protein
MIHLPFKHVNHNSSPRRSRKVLFPVRCSSVTGIQADFPGRFDAVCARARALADRSQLRRGNRNHAGERSGSEPRDPSGLCHFNIEYLMTLLDEILHHMSSSFAAPVGEHELLQRPVLHILSWQSAFLLPRAVKHLTSRLVHPNRSCGPHWGCASGVDGGLR